jgi:predicted AlkP superfamily pyrophosphatase or phosphodiesterase
MSSRELPRRFLAAGRAALATTLCLLAPACQPPAPEPEPSGPKLLLLIIADQFRGDYLERFASLWTGGLRRLLDEGVVFTNAHHPHSATLTAPGHASIATGCHPRRHGIIGNYWVDRVEGRRVYSVSDSSGQVSPARLMVPTLGDWLKKRRPQSRVYTASGKDRSAVLLGGHSADGAFWYDDGEWESSEFYPARRPAWLDEFHDLQLADRQLGTVWEPLPVPAEELAAAGVEAFDFGPLKPGFPYPYGGPSVAPTEGFYGDLYGSPWLDGYLTRFAETLMIEEELGVDAWTDLLALSFSALDAVGHSFGPDSPEVLDLLLRFDRRLGEFLEFVDRRIGLDEVVVAFSSDHGVGPMPELGRHGGRRLATEDVLCLQRVNGKLAERFGDGQWLLNGPFLNPVPIAEHDVERAEVETEAVDLLTACPGIARVWRRAELIGEAEPAARLFANSYHPERSPDLVIELEPFFVPTMAAATHGSAQSYDTHVPLVLLAPGLEPLRDEAPVALVDLAPTLGTLAGLTVPEVDGVDLGPRLRAAAP